MLDFSGLTAPWLHPVFEGAGYLVGGLAYRLARRRHGDRLGDGTRFRVILAAAIGAAVGSKLLHHLASPSEFMGQLAKGGAQFAWYLAGGKTIVGALLGGWLAVEWYKRRDRIENRTGDLFALPLVVGMAVGRLGCLFAGPQDDTLGIPTSTFMGTDFGDGIPRHPTPLYEILFLFALGLVLFRRQRAWSAGRPWRWCARNGDGFRVFLGAYLVFRLLVDFIKDYEVVLGLRIIQWACLFGLVVLLLDFLRPRTLPPPALIP